ncbi:unnamed protein product [Cochlearia groenlandica]
MRQGGFDKSAWQTIYAELDGICQERNLEGLQFIQHTLGCVEFGVPYEESHSNDGVGEDNVYQSNAMGSAHGSLEQLLAEEFDPVSRFYGETQRNMIMEKRFPLVKLRISCSLVAYSKTRQI